MNNQIEYGDERMTRDTNPHSGQTQQGNPGGGVPVGTAVETQAAAHTVNVGQPIRLELTQREPEGNGRRRPRREHGGVGFALGSLLLLFALVTVGSSGGLVYVFYQDAQKAKADRDAEKAADDQHMREMYADLIEQMKSRDADVNGAAANVNAANRQPAAAGPLADTRINRAPAKRQQRVAASDLPNAVPIGVFGENQQQYSYDYTWLKTGETLPDGRPEVKKALKRHLVTEESGAAGGGPVNPAELPAEPAPAEEDQNSTGLTEQPVT